jgi:hypothetical protein
MLNDLHSHGSADHLVLLFSQATISKENEELDEESHKQLFAFEAPTTQQINLDGEEGGEQRNLLESSFRHYEMDKQCGQVIQKSLFASMSVTFPESAKRNKRRLCVVVHTSSRESVDRCARGAMFSHYSEGSRTLGA